MCYMNILVQQYVASNNPWVKNIMYGFAPRDRSSILTYLNIIFLWSEKRRVYIFSIHLYIPTFLVNLSSHITCLVKINMSKIWYKLFFFFGSNIYYCITRSRHIYRVSCIVFVFTIKNSYLSRRCRQIYNEIYNEIVYMCIWSLACDKNIHSSLKKIELNV